MRGARLLHRRFLQRSGVGNAAPLAEFDIPLVHELPGVGENLQDHPEMYCNTSAKNRFPLYPARSGGISRESVRSGCLVAPALAPNHFEAGGFIRSREEFAWPNIQYHFLAFNWSYNGRTQ
ncbi:hypothetical protein ACNKHM_05775 [Shigella sonnei]